MPTKSRLKPYRALARACPPDDGNSLSGFKLEADILENVGAVSIVSDADVPQLNPSSPRPVVWDRVHRVPGA